MVFGVKDVINHSLKPLQTDQTFHLMFDEMFGLFGHLVWSHNICLAVLDEV